MSAVQIAGTSGPLQPELFFPELLHPTPSAAAGRPSPSLATLLRRRAAWGCAVARGRAARPDR